MKRKKFRSKDLEPTVVDENKPLLLEMVEGLEGAPCAGCRGALNYPPKFMGIWVMRSRMVPYALCETCADRYEDPGLIANIEKNMSNWMAGSPN